MTARSDESTGAGSTGTERRETASPSPTVAAAPAALSGWLVRRRFWLFLSLGVVIAALVVVLVRDDAPERYTLDSTRLDGYGAMAQVLEDRGTEVVSVRTGADALAAAEDDPQAMIVVHEGNRPANPAAVEDLAALDRETVWLSPNTALALQEFADVGRSPTGLDTADEEPLPAGPQCSDSVARTAESVPRASELFTVPDDSPADGCFIVGQDGGPEGYAMLGTDHGILLGTPEAFTNRVIDEDGGAALALGLFGDRDRVIWYSPAQWDMEAADGADTGEPLDLLPDWFALLALWLLICTGLFILVAGRRRGPVVSEPLPVLVPASESTEGRGRMYQQADAIGPSARTLRSAVLVRSARLLRLGAAEEHVVVEAAARQTGRSPRQVWEILDADGLRSNADLLRFARRIAEFEDELRVRTGLPRRTEQVLGGEATTDEGRIPHDPRTGRTPEDGASRD